MFESTEVLKQSSVDSKVAQFLSMGFGFATATLLAGINYKVWDNKLNEPHAFQYKEPYERRVFTLQEKSEGLDIKVGKADTDALRSKWNIPDNTETLAVGKTNVKGLEGKTFEGGSIKVRRQAGLPDLDEVMPNRPIKSPGKVARATRHAEEDIANSFVREVEKQGINPATVEGTLKIHQSNPTGVCPTCLQGLNSDKMPGVIKQLSQKYPKLIIEVTSDIVPGTKINGRSNFRVLNGKYID